MKNCRSENYTHHTHQSIDSERVSSASLCGYMGQWNRIIDPFELNRFDIIRNRSGRFQYYSFAVPLLSSSVSLVRVEIEFPHSFGFIIYRHFYYCAHRWRLSVCCVPPRILSYTF